ncbi:MAG: hypothetical protein ABL982_04940 [Vicinamibacterales bacterium]
MAGVLNVEDQKIAACVDRTRRTAEQIREWWRQKEADNNWGDRFDVVREFTPGDSSFGFFDTAMVDGRQLPLMGCVQEMFYDRQKKATGDDVRLQLREFVLGYFLRVSHLREPQVAPSQPPVSGLMRMLSWIPEPADSLVGFGYEQLLYKLRETGEIRPVAAEDRGAVVDLRSIGPTYDWVAMRVNIFDFNLGMSPLGPDGLKVGVPLKEVTHLLMTPESVIDRDNPAPGILGEYGFSYGLLPYTADAGIFAYGPGHFSAGFQSIVFQVLEDGAVRVRAVFVVNRPDKVLSIDVDPVEWSFRLANRMTFNMAGRAMAPLKALADMLPLRVSGVDPVSLYISGANLLTGGMAARHLGISMEQLERMMLVQHFKQHYSMLINSLLAWRMVPDWTRPETLPDFCNRGLVV